MTKVIQFLILGFAILHLSQASASEIRDYSKIAAEEMKINEFVASATKMIPKGELNIATKVAMIRAFNKIDRNGDLEIDRYEYMNVMK
jgi:1,2-phenylacetyl-CoA epoxidase catalytic subunit